MNADGDAFPRIAADELAADHAALTADHDARRLTGFDVGVDKLRVEDDLQSRRLRRLAGFIGREICVSPGKARSNVKRPSLSVCVVAELEIMPE